MEKLLTVKKNKPSSCLRREKKTSNGPTEIRTTTKKKKFLTAAQDLPAKSIRPIRKDQLILKKSRITQPS
jgi:hypothetical protein